MTGGLLAVNAVAQTAPQSSADLVRYLTYQADRVHPLHLNGCADPKEYRDAAHSLVALGASAVPEIESALRSLQSRGQQMGGAFNSRWLLFAYARIKGTAAYRQFQAMIDNPGLNFLRRDLDNAVAISLGLTSYVSSIRTPETLLHCGVTEPRDTLDDLILAWETNDSGGVEAQLGPNAQAALQFLLAQQSWTDLRTHTWRGTASPNVAVGYRLDVANVWSQPREMLDQAATDARRFVNLDFYPPNPELQAQFTNRAGQVCGHFGIRFLRTEVGLRTKYLVDETNMEGLLTTISVCAAMN